MLAGSVVGEAADALARACVCWTRLLDPHVIVLSGGVATAQLLELVSKRFRQLAWQVAPEVVELRLATAGADAGVVGAALHASRAA